MTIYTLFWMVPLPRLSGSIRHPVLAGYLYDELCQIRLLQKNSNELREQVFSDALKAVSFSLLSFQ